MANAVVTGATTQCTMGSAPSTLVVLPINMATSTFLPCATVFDIIPIVNVVPFGMCQSLANPTVAAATAAALGVLTPMPCIPVIAGPWSPGSSKTTLLKKKALLDSDTCNCAWAGTVSIKSAGQAAFTTQ